jgi:hypothetical protein
MNKQDGLPSLVRPRVDRIELASRSKPVVMDITVLVFAAIAREHLPLSFSAVDQEVRIETS